MTYLGISSCFTPGVVSTERRLAYPDVVFVWISMDSKIFHARSRHRGSPVIFHRR